MTELRILFDREFDEAYEMGATFVDTMLLVFNGNNLAGSYSKSADDIIIRASQGLASMLKTIDHEFIHQAIYLMGENSAMYDNISDMKGLP